MESGCECCTAWPYNLLSAVLVFNALHDDSILSCLYGSTHTERVACSGSPTTASRLPLTCSLVLALSTMARARASVAWQLSQCTANICSSGLCRACFSVFDVEDVLSAAASFVLTAKRRKRKTKQIPKH